jgi:protein TonB
MAESVHPPDGDILISGEEWQSGTTPDQTGRAESPGGQAFVDREVVPFPRNAVPRYPAELRDARIEGRVLARFVVDTSGRVTMESVVIDASDHPAFGDAVIETLRRSRFEPAEHRGRKVPQLVSRAFLFVIRE